MTLLCDLMAKYGSDKGGPGARHNYSAFYDMLFGPIRHDVKRVFELGVFGGASLRAWRDYFPNAQIFGADIDPTTMMHEERITTRVCDSRDAEQVKAMWREWEEPFDIIIDDGPHDLRSQVRFGELAVSRSRAFYIIEDLRAEDLPTWARMSSVDVNGGIAFGVVALVALAHPDNTYDNHLMVCRR